ncbi:Aste57867_10609 [Aphanomyces stellatus]|uniref:Aste57867_10609 protein n=1 Tax=Aphanomyces stellatus TaxID=120398 RepID=A0A485KRE2_9STRA|nr:hypothetical protein As57867_010569 [Aphanomyces stellatus]VFT87481.1 Aste57867_10609 [Aphanomyces stellatus]
MKGYCLGGYYFSLLAVVAAADVNPLWQKYLAFSNITDIGVDFASTTGRWFLTVHSNGNVLGYELTIHVVILSVFFYSHASESRSFDDFENNLTLDNVVFPDTLRSVSLRHGGIPSIPSTVQWPAGLKTIDLSANALHSISTTLTWPASLEHLDVSSNPLSGTFSVVLPLTLQSLNLSHTNLTALVGCTVPPVLDISNIPRLTTMSQVTLTNTTTAQWSTDNLKTHFTDWTLSRPNLNVLASWTQSSAWQTGIIVGTNYVEMQMTCATQPAGAKVEVLTASGLAIFVCVLADLTPAPTPAPTSSNPLWQTYLAHASITDIGVEFVTPPRRWFITVKSNGVLVGSYEAPTNLTLDGAVFPDSLRTLNLQRCGIRSIPSNVAWGAGLTSIDLSNNMLPAMPAGIQWPATLQHLSLGNNLFTTIPNDYAWSNVIELNLAGLPLTQVPSNLPPQLQILGVPNSHLTALPSREQLPSTITTINVAGSKIQTLPLSLDLPGLTTLDLSYNPMHGVLSTQFPATLQSLNLKHTQVTALINTTLPPMLDMSNTPITTIARVTLSSTTPPSWTTDNLRFRLNTFTLTQRNFDIFSSWTHLPDHAGLVMLTDYTGVNASCSFEPSGRIETLNIGVLIYVCVIPDATPLPTEAPTDVPTDAPTDVPTDTPTDVPTDAPTDEPTTDVPTDAPMDVVSRV